MKTLIGTIILTLLSVQLSAAIYAIANELNPIDVLGGVAYWAFPVIATLSYITYRIEEEEENETRSIKKT